MATTRLLTAEDLWGIGDDGHRYDLIRGELHRMAPAGGEHASIEMTIGAMLWTHARARNAGTVFGSDAGFVLARNPDTLLSPDVAFVRAERLPPKDRQIGFLELAPDLAVEVVSPSDRPSEVTEKVRIYLSAGVSMVLVVEPQPKTVTIHRPGRAPLVRQEGDVLDCGDVLPGFRVPVAEIFR